VACPLCGFLCVAHSGTSIVILAEESGCFLGSTKIPEDAPDKKYHLTSVIGGHTFSLSRRTSNGWLKFAFICYCATGEANADAAERSVCFNASGPIGARISMINIGIKLGLILKEDFLFVAANGW
jgi:hypothetical protein